MAKLTRSRKKRLILDIGTSTVRLCELAQTKSGYQLSKYYQKEFNSDPLLDDDTKKNLKRRALEELLKESKVRTKKTVFGVPGQSVFTRSRALPPVPEYKVNQIVRYEIQQQIPFSLDQIAMDYQVLDRTEAGGYEVMMAAIKVDVVEKHIQALHEAKRSIDIVDVCPLAAYNWLKHTGEFGDTGQCVALIDMGATTTDIVIERENHFRFTRPLNLGGNDITKAISAAFGLNFSDAEKVKRERGFAPTGDPKRDGKGGEAIGQILQRFVNEIMRSFAYFRSLPGGGQVNRVILCGGGACLRNIIPYMQRQLGIEVRIAQPLAGLAIAPSAQQVSDHPEQACVALGLALRCCQTVPLEINLIPPRVLEIARRKEQAFYWALSLTSVALIMASMIPVSANENKAVLERIDTLKRYIAEYDPELAQMIKRGQQIPASKSQPDLQKESTKVQDLQKQVELLDRARQGRIFWLDHLSAVNDARPATGGIWFSGIETTRVKKAAQDQPNTAGGRRRTAARGAGGGRGFGAARGGARLGARGGTAGTPGVISSGFPGIDPGGAMRSGRALGGGRGLGGGSGFGRSAGPAGGGRGRPGARGRGGQVQPPAITAPNGFVINGFAKSDEVIKVFVENLNKIERTMANREPLKVTEVFFSEASVNQVPREILWEAPTDGNVPFDRTDGGVRNPAYDDRVYSFTIIVHFQTGLTPEPEPQPQPAAQPGGRAFGLPGLGRPGRPGGPGGTAPGPGLPGQNAAPANTPENTA